MTLALHRKSKTRQGWLIGIAIAMVALAALAGTGTISAAGAAREKESNVVYNAIPDPLPPNMASLGFQATQTSEFGDYVHLAGTNRSLETVTVTMSDWALYSDYASDPRYSGDSESWTHPITLNVYAAVPGTPNTVGALLGTVTQNISIPWRPAGDPACGSAWKASNGQCYNGLAFNATFDMRSLHVTLPDGVIVGVAYNTQTYGADPIGVGGPYNSLNVGVQGSATVGTDDNTDNVFWNTSTASYYADGGASGVGTFREDSKWTPYGTVAIRITAGPASKDECKKDDSKTPGNSSVKSQDDCASHSGKGEKGD